MKLKKLLVLGMSCMLAGAVVTGCGSSEEEEVVEEVETDAEVEEDTEADVEEDADAEAEEDAEADVDADADSEEEGEPVSDETWDEVMANATTFGEYKKAAEALEEVPEDLVAYAEEINDRVMEVAALERDTTTEEEALAANDDIISWIDTFAEYVEIEE